MVPNRMHSHQSTGLMGGCHYAYLVSTLSFRLSKKNPGKKAGILNLYSRILPDIQNGITSCGIIINSFQRCKSKMPRTKKIARNLFGFVSNYLYHYNTLQHKFLIIKHIHNNTQTNYLCYCIQFVI